MCVCFHGEGRKPCRNCIWNPSCREHLMFAECFLVMSGWSLDTTESALILLHGFIFQFHFFHHLSHSLRGYMSRRRWIQMTQWKGQLMAAGHLFPSILRGLCSLILEVGVRNAGGVCPRGPMGSSCSSRGAGSLRGAEHLGTSRV